MNGPHAKRRPGEGAAHGSAGRPEQSQHTPPPHTSATHNGTASRALAEATADLREAHYARRPVTAVEALADVIEAFTIVDDDPFIDWAEFWTRDRADAEWIYDDILARGRGHAFYAPAKTGKSLLLLFIAVELATGSDDTVVVYLDYEMTDDDLRERLEDMGHGAATDLSRLRYWPIPSMPPLDTPAGAAALDQGLAKIEKDFPRHHLVVLIDTMGQAVEGGENDADTFRSFARNTGAALRRRGATYARADHAGKDLGKGQRGSSAKTNDVDIIWRISKTDGGLQLNRDDARMSWVPKKVNLAMEDEPLRFVRTDRRWRAGTKEVADLLDRLECPVDVTGAYACTFLQERGEGKTRAVVLDAVKYRKLEDEKAMLDDYPGAG